MVDMSELVSLMAPNELRGLPTLRWRIRTGSGGQRMQSESYVGKCILELFDASAVCHELVVGATTQRNDRLGPFTNPCLRLERDLQIWGPLGWGRLFQRLTLSAASQASWLPVSFIVVRSHDNPGKSSSSLMTLKSRCSCLSARCLSLAAVYVQE